MGGTNYAHFWRNTELFSDTWKKNKRTGYVYPWCRHRGLEEMASFGCHTFEIFCESSIYSNCELPRTL